MMKASKLIIAAILGLSIAVLNCGLGTMVNASMVFFNGYLPASCSCTYYFLCLCLFFIPGNFRMKSLWYCLLCGVVDSISGLGIMYGYLYASQATVTLLTSLCTPFAVLFSYFIIKTRFSIYEIILAFVAIGLAAGFAGTDFTGDTWLGAMLGAFAGIGYGLGATLN